MSIHRLLCVYRPLPVYTPLLTELLVIIIASLKERRIPNMSLIYPVPASYNYINRKAYFFSVVMRSCRLQWQVSSEM